MSCDCSVCANKLDWIEEALVYCPACGAELDYSDFLYIVKGQNEVVGCEHCITAAYADEIEN